MNNRKGILINLDGTVIDIVNNIPKKSTYLLKDIYNQMESTQNSESIFADAQPVPKAINVIEQLAYPQIKLSIQKHLSFTVQRFMVIAKEENIFAGLSN